MSNLKPLNDVALIKIEKNQYTLSGMQLAGGENKVSIGTGIVTEVPEYIPYVGFHAFAFESSFGGINKDMTDHFKNLIGKRVYWTALSERGTIFNKDDESFALIKLTDLIGCSEPDEVWQPETTELKY